MEFHSELKVYYILLQILTLVKTQIVDKDLMHNCLRLRSFHIDRLTYEVRLTNFAFASVEKATGQNQLRGSISGISEDKEALVNMIEQLSNLPQNQGDMKIELCTFSEMIQENYGAEGLE